MSAVPHFARNDREKLTLRIRVSLALDLASTCKEDAIAHPPSAIALSYLVKICHIKLPLATFCFFFTPVYLNFCTLWLVLAQLYSWFYRALPSNRSHCAYSLGVSVDIFLSNSASLWHNGQSLKPIYRLLLL